MSVDGMDSEAPPPTLDVPVSFSPSSYPIHEPPPLYTTYYTKSEELDQQQLDLYRDEDFASELPEVPPPFEHCYAPGEVPKQFGPRT